MNKRKKFRIVLDANWYISACISRNSRRTIYVNILKNSRLQVFYSTELLCEFDGVIKRTKFAKIITAEHINRFKTLTLGFLKKTAIGIIPELVRDTNDNYLLGVCEGCQADFLITGDKDLLILETYQNTTILTMSQFLSILSVI